MVGEALARLQLKALSGATQTALKARPGLLEQLQAEVTAQTGVEDVEFEQLERISRRSIFIVALLAAVTYFLVPQLADLPGIIDEIDSAQWGWTPLILLGSALTYIGAAIGLSGAVPDGSLPVRSSWPPLARRSPANWRLPGSVAWRSTSGSSRSRESTSRSRSRGSV